MISIRTCVWPWAPGCLHRGFAGRGVDRVLVDVTPYSFGPSYLGERGGVPYQYCYHPIIRSNTALPVTRTDKYYTSFPYQEEVDIDIYQGDDPDAMKNIPVGHFRVEGLRPTRELNPVLCRMSLDIDGILKVTAIEKETGKTKQITIDNALKPKSDAEIAAAREHLDALFDGRKADLEDLFNDHGDIQQENGESDDHGVIEVPFHTIHGGRGIPADWRIGKQRIGIQFFIGQGPSGCEGTPGAFTAVARPHAR